MVLFLFKYNLFGYDKDGFNRKGYNKNGYDKNGYDIEGYDKNGIDINGNRKYELYAGQILYHKIFGKGSFVEYTDINKFKVTFNDGEHIFVYPNAIGTYIFILDEESIKIKESEKTSNVKKEEDKYEKEHFKIICEELDKELKIAKDNYELSKYAFNDWSDSFDSSAFCNYSTASASYSDISTKRNEPYFSKIVSQKTGEIYIGKSAISGRVVDWADPVCSLYYEYKMYIGNQEYLLSLVRNFDIHTGKYYGFTDVYSSDNSGNTYSDELLIKIIEANRDNLQVHDIIATIQSDQYKIISKNPTDNIIVLGCAGSGKTMIMLHRLRYLIRNYQIDPARTVILSPTGILSLESDDLTSTLKLENINKYSTKSFNYHILSGYAKQENLFIDLRAKDYWSNNMLPNDFILNQYDVEFIRRNYLDAFVNVLKNNSNDRIIFINDEKMSILQELVKLFGFKKSNIEEFYNIFDIKHALAFNEFLHNFSNENIVRMISLLQNRLENQSDKQINKTKYKVAVLKYILNNNLAVGPTAHYEKKDKKGNILRGEIKNNPGFANAVYKFFDEFGWEGGFSKQRVPYQNTPFSFCQKLIELYEKYNRFNSFIEGDNNIYYFDIMQKLINDVKLKNGISINTKHEYELFLYTYLCEKTFGAIANIDLVFVDEFQDYANIELEMYSNIYPGVTFNLYGDFLQCINIKGMKSTKDLPQFTLGFDTHNISVNYRNSLEITEYVNTMLKTDMTPVGISGTVKTVNRNDIDLSCISSKSTAFILSDENLLNLSFTDSNLIKVIINSEDSLSDDKINLLPISLSKGLEFETVFVFDEKMSDNEKYVAYTRAWKNLYIVN